MNTTLTRDLGYAVRKLRKSPAFTAVAVVTLALGIGANTAIFGVVKAVLLQPLPYKDDGRLVVILHKGRNPVAPATFVDWKNRNHVFEQVGAAEYWTPNLTGTNNPEKLWALHVSPEIFPMLGVQPLLGRFLLPEEAQPGKEHVVLLDYRLWQSHFAGDPTVLSRSVTLNGEGYTVVGVMPPEFKFAPFWATKSQLWAPLALGPRITDRNGGSLRVFARLKPGVTLVQAQSDVATINAGIEREFPGAGRDMKVLSLREKVVGDIRPALLVLLGAVGFVLLIACANISHMLLARSAERQREAALRSALGAERWDLLRQFMTESLVLSLLGGGVGWLLAIWAVRVLPSLNPRAIPRVEDVSLDSSVLFFTVAVVLATTMIFGIVPALRAAAVDLIDALKEGGRGTGEGRRGERLSALLVSSEFALAVVLLAGAGLMVRSFRALQQVDPGFNPHRVLSMVIGVAGTEEGAGGRTGNFYRQVLQRVSAIPGVQSAGAINHLPLAGDDWGWPFYVEGRPKPRRGDAPIATFRAVFPGYFQTMQIPVLQGRDVAESDDLRAPGVLVVNEFIARRYWPGENAIGKRITLDDPAKSPSWLTVVGVVKNTSRSDLTSPPEEEVFVPYLQSRMYLENPGPPFAYLTLVVRTGGDPVLLASALRQTVRSLDRNVPISEVQSMDRVIVEATGQPRFYLLLLGGFAGVALLLAAVGIYGVVNYSVSRRTHEIGIRMALGARGRDVVHLLLFRFLTPALIGVAVGTIGALALTRLMASLLFKTQPTDALTFTVAILLLSGVAVAAIYGPARRAAKVDPMVALRYE